ncbi:hypothetical protein J1614_002731 [Plenodomus biglobosus]|nr:hypothetical protein J1614_002731 [Plenodomus biglobosus]
MSTQPADCIIARRVQRHTSDNVLVSLHRLQPTTPPLEYPEHSSTPAETTQGFPDGAERHEGEGIIQYQQNDL